MPPSPGQGHCAASLREEALCQCWEGMEKVLP